MTNSNQNEEIINRAALKAAGLGVPGSFFPPLDMAGMSYIWIKMMRDLSKASGHKVNFILATKFILSVTSGAAFYLGGSKLLGMLLHAIPGAGNVTAASTNAAFNWIYTLRLGKLLANQFSQPNFDSNTLIISASSIAGLIFAIPSSDEVSDAFHTIGDVLGWHSHAGAVADLASSGGDLADGAMNLLPDASHADLSLGHSDLPMSAAAHHPLPHHADIPFGSSHPINATVGSGPSLEVLGNLQPAEQQEALSHIAQLAREHNMHDLADNAMRAMDGKVSVMSVLKDATKLPLRDIAKISVKFGAKG
ncbi:MAG: hypothetical protein ACLGJB_26070 [Blastocatellia bacterium]